MKLSISESRLPAATLRRLILVGFAVATLVIHVPIAAMVSAYLLSSSDRLDSSLFLSVLWLLFPAMILFQAYLLGFLVQFGLWIYSRFKAIEFVQD